jgi:hypothetical protein
MNPNNKTMSRREFFKTTAIFGLGTAVMMTVPPKASAAQNTLKTTIARNHGHTMTVTLSELLRNAPQVYKIKGSSLHSHEVEITSEILSALQKEKIVEVESSSDFGHDHVITLELV